MTRHAIEHIEPRDRLKSELINFEPQRIRLRGNAVARVSTHVNLHLSCQDRVDALIEHHATLSHDWSTTDVLYAEPVLADWTSPVYNADMFRTCVGTLKRGSFEITGTSYDPQLNNQMSMKAIPTGKVAETGFGYSVCKWSHFSPTVVIDRFNGNELFELYAVLVGIIARAAAIRLNSGHQIILYRNQTFDYSLVISGKTVVKSLDQLSLDADPFLSVWNASLDAVKQINEFLDARHLQDESSYNSVKRWVSFNG